MNTEIPSKSEIDIVKSKLNTDVTSARTYVTTINAALNSIESYEEFNLSAVASTIASNFDAIVTDLETISKNVTSYIDNLYTIDQDTEGIESYETSDYKNIEMPTIEATAKTNVSGVKEVSTQVNNNTYSNFGNKHTYTTINYSNPSSNYTPSSSNSNSVSSPTISDSNNSSPASSSNSSSTPSNTSSFGTTPVTTNPSESNVDISKYHNRPEAGFEVTTGNLAYNLSDADIDLLCAIVAAESDQTYDDALAVITTILNRCEASNWVAAHGTNPIAQATAPNQFVVYQHGSYKKYTNGNAPETVKQAVADALAGVRNHKYLSFRSNGSTGYSNNLISSTGNRYK